MTGPGIRPQNPVVLSPGGDEGSTAYACVVYKMQTVRSPEDGRWERKPVLRGYTHHWPMFVTGPGGSTWPVTFEYEGKKTNFGQCVRCRALVRVDPTDAPDIEDVTPIPGTASPTGV